MTVVGAYFWAWVRMKFSRNDLPLPVAPRISVCPTSSQCRFQKYGVC
jgi:hypothetical protein